ncbi:MAG: terminase large subunit [Candidatus Bathyarchaeia archaeon]
MSKPKSLTHSAADYARVISNPIEFAKECWVTVQRGSDRVERVRFGDIIWDWQKDLLLEIDRNDRLVILKARQLGVTWLACMYALWTLFTKPNATVLVMSTTQREATGIIERVEFIYENLPDIIRLANPITKPHSRTEIGFLNGSNIIALPSTEKSGRSYTSTLTILDEFAFHEYAEKNWAAITAATEKGKLIVISTANGINNFFYKLYSEAKEGKNNFKAIFLPYTLHPDRTEYWYEQQAQILPLHQLMQEYPMTDVEAFTHTGSHFFEIDWIRQYTPKQWLPFEQVQYMFRRTPPYLWSSIKIFKTPIVGHAYSIGVDPTGALSSRADNAAVVIIDAATGEQVAEFAQTVSIDDLAPLICDLYDFYKGIVVCERNGVGGELNKRLWAMGLNLWNGQYLATVGTVAKKRESRLENAIGLYVNHSVKAVLFERLSAAIAKKDIGIASDALLQELANLEITESGLPKARQGTDDRVMALAYAWLGVLYLRETGQAISVHPFPDMFNLEFYLRKASEPAPLPPFRTRQLIPL